MIGLAGFSTFAAALIVVSCYFTAPAARALFAGLSKRIDLRLVSRLEFRSGAVAMRYEPRK
jgi:hypothetical protein